VLLLKIGIQPVQLSGRFGRALVESLLEEIARTLELGAAKACVSGWLKLPLRPHLNCLRGGLEEAIKSWSTEFGN
jgi:hypothetical protein